VLVLGIDQATCSSPMMKQVNYIDSKDGTTSGSCNGHPVIAFDMLYHMIGRDGFKKMAKHCFSNVVYLTKRLCAGNNDVFHNEGALTIFIVHPLDNFVYKYALACSGDSTHVITMQRIPIEHLDHFIVNYVAWNCTKISL
jgi:histidine decarboxylase